MYYYNKASSRTDRGALSPTRVKMLKQAMVSKYNLSSDKADQKWLLVVRSINSKGRSLKFKIKNKVARCLDVFQKK